MKFEALTLSELKKKKNELYLEYYKESNTNEYFKDLFELDIQIAIKEIERGEEKKAIRNLIASLKTLKSFK